MTRSSSAARIFVYNWPVYAATWLGALVAVVAASSTPRPTWVMSLAVVAVGWSVLSLVVSDYVYDRSELASGAWIGRLLPPRVETWATVDAGLDAEVDLDRGVPGRCVGRLDVFDGDTVRAPSVVRARAHTARKHAAAPCSATALALGDATCDVVFVVFTAHEVRGASARAAFLRETRRALRPGGRVVLVEHLRDLPNFVAFGPGFLHFVARSEWLALAERAGLRVAGEIRVTPWVMALALEAA